MSANPLAVAVTVKHAIVCDGDSTVGQVADSIADIAAKGDPPPNTKWTLGARIPDGSDSTIIRIERDAPMIKSHNHNHDLVLTYQPIRKDAPA